jgi:TatD DNase family protein
VRSRSAYDRRGNHALKASLGFGISPGRNTTDGPVDTAFFVLPLRLSQERLAETMPSLDAHAHLDPGRTSEELAGTGAVLAFTLSLDEAAHTLERREPLIAWGVGCHPRNRKAQEAFDAERFGALVERAAIVGEIGLDTGSRVPLELQLQTFRQALAVVAERPRLVSIHSYRATGLVLEELRKRPVTVPVLHWWTGTADETQEAVALGCYFSIHSAVARHSKFRTRVPPERLLIESDHGFRDPPTAIPCRVEWVEHLVGQQLKLGVEEVRRLAWRNLATIIRETGTWELFPGPFATILAEVGPDKEQQG